MGALTNAPPTDLPAALAAGPPPPRAGLRAWRRMGLPVRLYLLHALRRARLRLRLRGRVAFEGPTFVGAGAVIDVEPGARLLLGRWSWLGEGALVHVRGGGEVRIGAGAALGTGCAITAHERIEVGEGCLIGDRAMLVDFDHDTADVERPVRVQGLLTGAVRINAGARLGAGACVLRGVTVGAGASVGPRSVVTRDVPPGAAVEGAPAARAPAPTAAPPRGGRPSRPGPGR